VKLTEAQAGILATIGAVTFAILLFLFQGGAVGDVREGKTVNTWGIYVETWFLIVLLIAVPIAIILVILRKARRRKTG
jgi:Na+/H+ antiporter NhaC